MFEWMKSTGPVGTYYVVGKAVEPLFYRRMSVYKTAAEAAVHAMHAIRKYDASKKEGYVTPYWMRESTDPSFPVAMYKLSIPVRNTSTDSKGDISVENMSNMTHEIQEKFKTLADLFKKYGITIKNGSTADDVKRRKLLLKTVHSLYTTAKEKFPQAYKYTAWYTDNYEKDDFLDGEEDSLSVIVFGLDDWPNLKNVNEISVEIEKMAKWMTGEVRKNSLLKSCSVTDSWYHNEGNISIDLK